MLIDNVFRGQYVRFPVIDRFFNAKEEHGAIRRIGTGYIDSKYLYCVRAIQGDDQHYYVYIIKREGVNHIEAYKKAIGDARSGNYKHYDKFYIDQNSFDIIRKQVAYVGTAWLIDKENVEADFDDLPQLKPAPAPKTKLELEIEYLATQF